MEEILHQLRLVVEIPWFRRIFFYIQTMVLPSTATHRLLQELILLIRRWAKDRGICHAPKVGGGGGQLLEFLQIIWKVTGAPKKKRGPLLSIESWLLKNHRIWSPIYLKQPSGRAGLEPPATSLTLGKWRWTVPGVRDTCRLIFGACFLGKHQWGLGLVELGGIGWVGWLSWLGLRGLSVEFFWMDVFWEKDGNLQTYTKKHWELSFASHKSMVHWRIVKCTMWLTMWFSLYTVDGRSPAPVDR